MGEVMVETEAQVLYDGPLASQNVYPGRGEEDLIPDLLNPGRVPVVPESQGAKLGLEKRNDFVFQAEFRIHKEERQMGDEVFQPVQESMDLASLDVFRGIFL